MTESLQRIILPKEIKFPCSMRGQALIESYVVLPLFAFMMFGVLELAYIYHAKATLNAATFDAARSGSLHNAKKSPMMSTMARTMSALYLRKDPNVANAEIAYGKALTEIKLGRARVNIISPTEAVFKAFRKMDYVMEDQIESKTQQYHIPNDNLMWRDASYRTINSGNTEVVVNLQDANLLKINTTWCHKLVVPVLKKVIHSASILSATADQLACDVYGAAAPKISDEKEYYIAITSSAIVRMQSSILGNDLEKDK